jgi:hypothetical protein
MGDGCFKNILLTISHEYGYYEPEITIFVSQQGFPCFN